MSDLRRKMLAGTVVGAMLSGCASLSAPPADIDLPPGQIVTGCCDGAGIYPDWMIALADANVGALRRLGLIQLRPGRMTTQPQGRINEYRRWGFKGGR